MHNLRLQHEDTYTAYQWLMQNRNMFRGKIHGPILLQLQLKDTRYADIVESVLGGERGSHLRVRTPWMHTLFATNLRSSPDLCLWIQGGLRTIHKGNSRQATLKIDSLLARQHWPQCCEANDARKRGNLMFPIGFNICVDHGSSFVKNLDWSTLLVSYSKVLKS